MDIQLLLTTALRAVIAYAVIIAYVRVSGNRSLAKLRAFDFVMTIALGSLLASTIVLSTVPVTQGLLAMGMLVLLQYVVAQTSVRSKRFARLITNEPILLYRRDGFDERALRRARVTEEEVTSAMRSAGHAGPETVDVAWLEVNGQISVSPTLSRSAPPPGRPEA